MARYLLFLALLYNATCFAQNSVAGTVVDSNQVPVPYAIVGLLSAEDSTVLKGTPTDEHGYYFIGDLKSGNYLLRVSCTGYNDGYTERFYLDTNSTRLNPKIVLSGTVSLIGVTVTAIRPTIEFKNGNTIVNIENSALAKGNSVFELLPKLPGVSVDNNVISIQGKSGVIVMIDNRVQQVSNEQLVNILKSMSAESIERIEILRNPPVKYDAAGTSGMINIITKKNSQMGFVGSVFVSTAQGFYNNSSAGLSLNYRNRKFAFFSSISGDDGWFRSDDRHIRLFDQDSGLTQMNSANHWREHQRGVNFKVGADWFLDSATTIGVKVDGGPGAYTSYGITTDSVFQYNNMGFDHLGTTNYIPNQWIFVNYNLNAEKLLDTLGTRISLSADYTDGKEEDRSFSDSYYYDANEDPALVPDVYRNSNNSGMRILSGKVDYLKVCDSISSFESGVKVSTVEMNNDYLLEQKDFTTGSYYSNPSFTNKYDYSEQTYAAYVNYSYTWKLVDMQLGVRAEETVLSGYNHSSDFKLKNNYFNLFPNLSFAYKQSEAHEFQLNLNRRVDRPVFDDMNPFAYYLNPFSYYQGNPFLQPNYSNSISLTHSFKGAVVNTISYERVNQYMLNYTIQNDSTKIFFQTIGNIEFENVYAYNIFIQHDVKAWWAFTFMADFIFMDFKEKINDVQFRTYGMNYSATLMNTFVLPRELNLEVVGVYRGPNLYGITRINPVWMVSAALKKTFFNERLSCSVGMNNIFNSMKFHTHAQFDNQDWNYYVQMDNRRVNLSISYNFGKAEVVEREMNSNEDEKNRLNL